MRTRSSVWYTLYDQTVIYDAKEARACNFPTPPNSFSNIELENATSKVTKIFHHLVTGDAQKLQRCNVLWNSNIIQTDLTGGHYRPFLENRLWLRSTTDIKFWTFGTGHFLVSVIFDDVFFELRPFRLWYFTGHFRFESFESVSGHFKLELKFFSSFFSTKFSYGFL